MPSGHWHEGKFGSRYWISDSQAQSQKDGYYRGSSLGGFSNRSPYKPVHGNHLALNPSQSNFLFPKKKKAVRHKRNAWHNGSWR